MPVEQQQSRVRLTGQTVLELLGWILLIGIAILVLVPFVWMISTSLKPMGHAFRVPIEWIPSNPLWENYPIGLSRRPFGRYFFNSAFVGISVTFLTLFLGSLAGFGLAKYRFRGQQVIFTLILATLMLPFQVIMIPVFLLVRDLGWLDSYTGLIIPEALTAFAVFLTRQYILTIPDAMLDAARVDGASEWKIYSSVILPMCKPILAVLAIFTFRSNWDSLLWPLIAISTDSMRTLPLGLSMFITDYDIEENLMMAVAVVASLPVFVVFLFAQKHFTQGITLSGIKG